MFCCMSDGAPLPYLCIAGSGDLLLVVSQTCDVFLWEVDRGQSEFTTVKDTSHLSGVWSTLDSGGQSVTVTTSRPELTVDAVFTSQLSVC